MLNATNLPTIITCSPQASATKDVAHRRGVMFNKACPHLDYQIMKARMLKFPSNNVTVRVMLAIPSTPSFKPSGTFAQPTQASTKSSFTI